MQSRPETRLAGRLTGGFYSWRFNDIWMGLVPEMIERVGELSRRSMLSAFPRPKGCRINPSPFGHRLLTEAE